MKTIFIIHVIKYNARRMPEFTHAVGDIQSVRDQLLGFADKEQFTCIYALIAYATKKNVDYDYQMVHNYEIA